MALRLLGVFVLALSLGRSLTLNSFFKEGISIPFVSNHTLLHTWLTVHGDLTPEVLSHRPLLVLHGGPGFTHDYMLPLEDLSSSRPVIFYDQVGSGRSSHPGDSVTWGMDLFLAELDNVISTLDIGSDFDLLGHSWGGVLAAEYAVQRENKGLKHLVFTDSLPASNLWDQSEMQLLSTFPEQVQQDVAVGFSDPEKYRAALGVFFGVHGCTLVPWPKPLNHSFDSLFADPTPQLKMGPILSSWSIIDRLNRISIPTLVLNGAADISQDFVNQPYLDNIPGSIHVKFMNSSHTPMWEEREAYMKVVGNFLG